MTGFPPAPDLSSTSTAALLTALGLLFLGRVIGQVIVVVAHPGWLPPMEQWYSGVLAYRWLLLTQVVMLAGMAALIIGLLGGAAWAIGPYPALGAFLVFVAYVYAGAMAVRYHVRMARRPDQRWLGGCIPIVFHVVLATWLWVIGGFWRGG